MLEYFAIFQLPLDKIQIFHLKEKKKFIFRAVKSAGSHVINPRFFNM